MIDLCTLGTGGTLPLPDRALSSLYVRVNGRGLLIDCGEGTQVGIRRLGWGFRCIDAILLTHFHGDHCTGLPGLLLSMAKAQRTEPVDIYGPTGLLRIVEGLLVVAPNLPFPLRLHELLRTPESFEAIGMTVTAFPVRHGIPCIGYRLHLARQRVFDPVRARKLGIPLSCWKTLQYGESVEVDGQYFEPADVMGEPRRGITFLYTTDTRPAQSIVDHGYDTDLMILEGMYGDHEKRPQALQNHHMLFEEAAELALKAGTKRLLLTHFSTSVEDPAIYLPDVQCVFPDTETAYDGMCMTLKYPEDL